MNTANLFRHRGEREPFSKFGRTVLAASVDGDAGSLRSHGLGEATSDATACSRDEDNLASQHLLVVPRAAQAVSPLAPATTVDVSQVHA